MKLGIGGNRANFISLCIFPNSDKSAWNKSFQWFAEHKAPCKFMYFNTEMV